MKEKEQKESEYVYRLDCFQCGDNLMQTPNLDFAIKMRMKHEDDMRHVTNIERVNVNK